MFIAQCTPGPPKDDIGFRKITKETLFTLRRGVTKVNTKKQAIMNKSKKKQYIVIINNLCSKKNIINNQ